MPKLLTEKPDRRYHLIIDLEVDQPHARYIVTLGYIYRYELTTYLKLARNLIEAGNLDQIRVEGGRLHSAEGIDTKTGAVIGTCQAR